MSQEAVSASIIGVSQSAFAKHIDVSQQRVAQLVKEGVLKTLPNGKLDPDQNRVSYIRWLRDETRKSSASVSASKAQEARARQIDLTMAREERELVPLDGAIFAMDEFAAAAVLEFKNIPSRFTRDVQLRRKLKVAIDGALKAVAGKMGKCSEAIRNLH